MEPSIDQTARDMAQASLNRIDKHEAVCAERAIEAKDSRERIERGVAGLYSWLRVGLIGIITALGTVAGTLALEIMTHK